MIHVYLDDFRKCPKGFVLAKNSEECKLLIDDEQIDILSLDFDLGWNQPTGMDVVRHLIATKKFPKRIFLHTSSLAGMQQMYAALRDSIPQHVELVGGPMQLTLIEDIAANS